MHCLEKMHAHGLVFEVGLFSRLLLQTQEGGFFSGWTSFQDYAHWACFQGFTVSLITAMISLSIHSDGASGAEPGGVERVTSHPPF